MFALRQLRGVRILNSTGLLRLSTSLASAPQQQQAVKIVLNDSELTEHFVKGSGNGGQKINKTSNCVVLTHLPTGTVIKCQKTRSLEQNRKEARRLLILRLDASINGELSKLAKKADKIRRRKSKQRQRTREKYGDIITPQPPDNVINK